MIKSVLDTIEPPRYVVFLGGGCSLATEPTAALSGAFYHVVQVSRDHRLLTSVCLIPLPTSLLPSLPPSLAPCYCFFQISFGASSPVLSERENYQLFFRTIPSETLPNAARFALMNMYDWCKVATLHETANIFSRVSSSAVTCLVCHSD